MVGYRLLIGSLIAFLVGLSSLAVAESINWQQDKSAHTLTLRFNANVFAAFQPQQNELWLVADKPLSLKKIPAFRVDAGLTDIEYLNVDNGNGLRMVFDKTRYWRVVGKDGTTLALEGTLTPVKFDYLDMYPQAEVKRNVYVESIKQHIGFQVTLSNKVQPWADVTEVENGVLLPTLAGVVKLTDVIMQLPDIMPAAGPEEGEDTPLAANAVAGETLPRLPAVDTPDDTMAEQGGLYIPGTKILFTLPKEYVQRQEYLNYLQEQRRSRYARARGASDTAAKMALDLAEGKTTPVLPPLPTGATHGDETANALNGAEIATQEEGAAANAAPVSVSPLAASNAGRAIPKASIFIVKPNSAEDNYYDRDAALNQKLAAAKTPTDIYAIRQERAKLALVFRRYEEIPGLLQGLPTFSSGALKDPDARTLLGISYLLKRDYKRAATQLTLPGGPKRHADVWLGVLKEHEGNHAEALELLTPENETVINIYPNYLQQAVQLSKARALLHTKQYQPLFDYIDRIELALNGKPLPSEMVYLKAKAYIAQHNMEEGTRLLAQVAEMEPEPIAYVAKYDFIKLLDERGELSREQVLSFLEQLRQLWRGDELEEHILYDLGTLYLQQRNFRDGLQRLKMLLVYFPDAYEDFAVTDAMTNAFMTVFEPQNREDVDDLTLLGIYYDYRELSPAGAKGDALIAEIGDILRGLNLFDRAIKLYDTQLNYRLTDKEEKAKMGLILAELYRKTRKFEAALNELEKWRYADMPAALAREYDLEHARVLVSTNNFMEARAMVENYLDDAGRDLLVDAAWGAGDWAMVQNLLEPVFNSGEHLGLKDTRVGADFARLAYAYTRLQNVEGYTKLLEQYKADLAADEELRDVVHVFAANLGVNADILALPNSSASSPLQTVTKQLLSYNALLSNYNALRDARIEAKVQRGVYNEKMEALDSGVLQPPPAF